MRDMITFMPSLRVVEGLRRRVREMPGIIRLNSALPWRNGTDEKQLILVRVTMNGHDMLVVVCRPHTTSFPRIPSPSLNMSAPKTARVGGIEIPCAWLYDTIIEGHI